MSRTTYYTASSLDGYIADAEHSLAWLLRQEHDASGPLNHAAFLARVGAMVMGSTTYEWILRHERGRWPYPLPAWVMTTRDLPTISGDVRFARGDVRGVHAGMLAAADGRDLWVVGGGDLAGQFADAGLLDELVVSLAPVTLGAGAPLLPRALDLRLEELARNGAFACARYTVLDGGSAAR
ncbi:dihydrofolate reductase family protein [Egicoccus halophilus]|uniref:Dihydrofolate reductase n=1 Tax=Egicoccus halophilus TaxID=1670830 RepID=A0A8J3EW29_9ACTN|nr:dihydrofolate reductase family protein [Egicoccus halophilus]GGI02516.1 dihydrofolate reductase [Egicoccus halophilus]